MYHPMRLLLLANTGYYFYFFMLLYPIIVIIPASFSYIYDQDINEQIFIQSRTGIKNYYFGKLIATFLSTFNIFTIPFLAEIILNSIAFPNNATGLLSNMSIYESTELESIHRLLLPNLYIRSIYLYVILLTIIWGIVSGVIATYALTISIIIKFKYKTFLFLPIYILSYVLYEVQYILPQIDKTTYYFFYFDIFDTSRKSLMGYILCILMMTASSILLAMYKSGQDSLL
ncbi:hypothetical protein CG709_07420 [Lachnotalea glycerini]|nr:hypothetical protein CG709_07420 [Lachnotalea glycerini]